MPVDVRTSRIVLVTGALTLSLTTSLGCGPEPGDPDGSVIDNDADDADDDGANEDGDDDASSPGGKPPAHAEAVPCASDDAERPCVDERGVEGTTQCVLEDGEEVWTECLDTQPCWPGDGYNYGCMGGYCAWDGESLFWFEWSEPDCDTPLVVNFERAPLAFTASGAATFDISGVGACEQTDWPTLPWLALDRDHDGVIEDGRELFGSGTVLGTGARAADGFSALAELDLDRDGMITARDPAFAELVLWSDANDDRRGDLGELTPIADVALIAIHLDTYISGECDARGNCGGLATTFEFRSATGEHRLGEIVDVVLPCR